MNCEDCNYYVYDEDDDDWYCTVNMDEYNYARLVQGHYRQCPYYRHEDDRDGKILRSSKAQRWTGTDSYEAGQLHAKFDSAVCHCA